VSEQECKEARLEQFLACIQNELKHLPRTRAERQNSHIRITEAFRTFGETALGFEEPHLRLLLGDGFSAIGTQMVRRARAFDPGVPITDVLQASRNAWTACGLEMLFGQAMNLTPSIFAYSMMYPYSDNYLDDPEVPAGEKRGFNVRFRRRLGGEACQAANRHERILWRLVGMVEGQYERAAYPAVFAGLLLIQKAQEESLALLRKGNVDVLRLSFAKGGASVLADGYLAAGTLTPEQARFAFFWGVLLQLGDDLQDIREDRANGLRTLFSQAGQPGTLDRVTSRTLHFGRRVMGLMHGLPDTGCPALRQLIQRSSLSLIIRSAGEAADLYSRDYLERLESASPFRFSFLNERRKQFEKRSLMLARLFEAFLEGDDDEPAFPWLPNSLMPR
jgi:hypothetical protein